MTLSQRIAQKRSEGAQRVDAFRQHISASGVNRPFIRMLAMVTLGVTLGVLVQKIGGIRTLMLLERVRIFL
jgi:hypothetical protein